MIWNVLLVLIIAIGVAYVLKSNSKTEFLDEEFQIVQSFVQDANTWLFKGDKCDLRANYVQFVNESLAKYIKGQSFGTDAIINSFSAWEFQRSLGVEQPLVLAITGPTGVGKSETAFRIGEALFETKKETIPCGLLVLRGEDLSPTEVAAKGLHTVHTQIRQQIIDHIINCNDGYSLIVFDEIQKVAPGILNVLMSGLEERGTLSDYSSDRNLDIFGPRLTVLNDIYKAVYTFLKPTQNPQNQQNHQNQQSQQQQHITVDNKVFRQVSTTNCIFIFISDIGADVMTKMLLSHGGREQLPKATLRNEIKQALDEQWSRLNFGKVIHDVVPFLPLEPTHILQILRYNIDSMNTDMRLMKWQELVVDADVLEFLISPAFIKYSVHLPKAVLVRNAAAANNNNNNNMETPSSMTATSDQSSALSSVSGSSDGGSTKTATASTKIFATWGARSLENAGPLQDLRSMMQRFARPWRPDQVLHVGLAKPEHYKKWGVPVAKQPEIYFQWCKIIDIQTTTATAATEQQQQRSNTDGNINSNVAFDSTVTADKCTCVGVGVTADISGLDHTVSLSDCCETVWFGLFPS